MAESAAPGSKAATQAAFDKTQVGAPSDLAETNVPSRTAAGALDATVVPGGAAPAAAPPAPSGESKGKINQLGDFKLVRKLGKGGMGEVYLATQVSLDRPVALKTLSKELTQKPDFVQRFLREARSMAKLQHPNAVQVYAADSAHGIHYAAIEFIDGQSMQKWMDQLGKLSIGDALHVTLVCAEALQHAHELNMIHRDIKPDNILVTKKGIVKVADFGLAKAVDEDVSMTQSGTGLGTPLYMAPEQARNAKHVDRRTDVYALGCTLYYFLTGQLPFSGSNTLELIVAKEKGKFTPARQLVKEIPEKLDLMIDKMMAKDPQHRYASCAEVIKDLSSLLLDSPALTFIATTGETAAVRATAVRTVVNIPGGATAVGRPADPPRSSAEDAARKPVAAEAGAKQEWLVQHTDKKTGKVAISKMTTEQIQRGLQGEVLGIDTKVKKSKSAPFAPVAQFPEFDVVVSKRVVKQQAATKSRDMKDFYAGIEKQQKWNGIKRYVKGLFGSAMGFVKLLIWLAFLAACAYGIWLAIPYAYQLVKAQLNM